MDDATRKALYEKAAEMATNYDVKLEKLKGKRIRVMRAVVYEGEATAVFAQLVNSLSPGSRTLGKPDKEITITVIDDGILKVLER